MIKGPAALFLPLAAAAAAAWVWAPARPGLRPSRLLVWTALCLLLAAPWYLLIMTHSTAAASADVTREMDALLRQSGHPGPFYFYLYTLPAMLLPWGLLIPFALIVSWKTARRRAGVRLLLAWFFSSLLLMSLVRSKQSHYATLLLPPAALLIGVFLDAALRSARRYQAFKTGLTIAAVTLLVASAAAAARFIPTPWSYAAALAALAAIPVVLRLKAERRPAADIAAIAAGTAIVSWAYATGLGEWFEPARATKDAAAAVISLRGPQTRVYLAGRKLNTMQYYTDGPIQRVGTLREGLDKAAEGDIILLAQDRANPVALSPDTNRPPLRVYRARNVAIELYVK
jgi:4-amino-4-deoxy-L-arabinose transferase-like glycosyltransferase